LVHAFFYWTKGMNNFVASMLVKLFYFVFGESSSRAQTDD